MNALRIGGIVLIAAGIVGIILGTFSFTKKTHEVTFGSIEMSVEEKSSIHVPLWAGIAAIAAGGALLLAPRKRSS